MSQHAMAKRLNAAGLAEDFCPMPWIHVYADPLGDIRPCCWYSDTLKGEPNLRQFDSMDAVMNCHGLHEVRERFTTGVRDPACDNCRRHESHGRFSKRQRAIDSMTDDELSAIALDPRSHLDTWTMRHFDFRFDNTCNLKCRTCNSTNSSRIAAEERQRGIAVPTLDFDVSYWYDMFKREVTTARSIYLAGGEPFMMPQTYDLLSHLINHGMTDVMLSCSTNMTHMRYKDRDIADLLAMFTDVTISMSLDHHGSKASYVRHGSDWSDIIANYQHLKIKAPRVRLQIDCVISALNALDICEIIDVFQANFPGLPINLIPAIGKPYLDLNNLPNRVKVVAAERIRRRMDQNQDDSLDASLQDIIKRLLLPADPRRDGSLRYQMDLLDTVRGETMAKALPELYEGLL